MIDVKACYAAEHFWKSTYGKYRSTTSQQFYALWQKMAALDPSAVQRAGFKPLQKVTLIGVLNRLSMKTPHLIITTSPPESPLFPRFFQMLQKVHFDFRVKHTPLF